jgi:hypothetical protein
MSPCTAFPPKSKSAVCLIPGAKAIIYTELSLMAQKWSSRKISPRPTGIGLGVHITIFPDANGFAAADGQKDVCAFFDRVSGDKKTSVLKAFRADWIGRESDRNLKDNWRKGGKLRIVELKQSS